MTFATPSCLFTHSVGASCSHATVMCWIVSDSFPHLLHNSSMFWLLQNMFLVNMTWSCIAVKKTPSVSANKSAFVSHLFDASMSTYYWLRSSGCRPCKTLWDHCLLTSLVYSSSMASSFSFARNKSSGVYLSSAFTTAAWRGDVTCRLKKYIWRSFTCSSCSLVISIKPYYYRGKQKHYHSESTQAVPACPGEGKLEAR
jgi:hypothetical protein